ncbi:hypothetical protein CLV30_13155 [Haloactinopolyspora alba]|uniref:Uncharacterized protein n=1 Tax=Haloactinopolyspora alba TaxID=648780 RepID=A0A2P8D741_9ACTN|nr:hypothetical protein [Haloactinopolyspora alba]PSK93028.1 hypothetical protein CLV30_13155 [Haloactinopolyspora alba]
MPETPKYRLPYDAGSNDPNGARLGRRLAVAAERELSRIDGDIGTAQSEIDGLETSLTDYVLNKPIFRSIKRGTGGIPSGGETDPGFFDFTIAEGGFTGGGSSNIVVFPLDGFYEVHMVALWAGASSPGAFQVIIRKNSTSATDPTTGTPIATDIGVSDTNGSNLTTAATASEFFQAGENVQMGVLQNTGGTVNIIGGNSYASFYEIVFLRPAA